MAIFFSLPMTSLLCSFSGVMARFSTFHRKVLLSAPLPVVFDFHENPHNISRICPPLLKIKHIECSVPARVSEEFYLRVSLCGIPMEWRGYWESVDSGKDGGDATAQLVDGAKKSPFTHWRHQHLFRAVGSYTEMTDRVEYSLGNGVFARFLNATLMRIIFEMMFLGRHIATRRYFVANYTG
jgi:ligand-binding SRPBCC domain-containing protein